MRLIDANALIGFLHNQIFIDGDDRSRVYRWIEEQPTIELLNKSDVMRIINSENAVVLCCTRLRSTDEVLCSIASKINSLQTIQTTIEADIDRAAIMRLCNEIEDIVSEISKLSENYLIYSDCKSILDRTKAIGKELTEDAGTDD